MRDVISNSLEMARRIRSSDWVEIFVYIFMIKYLETMTKRQVWSQHKKSADYYLVGRHD